MSDFFSGFLIGIGFLWSVQFLLAFWLRQRVEQEIKELEQLAQNQLAASSVMARVEEIDGCFYVYDQATGEFLAQGNSMNDLSLVLKQRWPERTVFVKDGNKDAIQRLKATQQVDSL